MLYLLNQLFCHVVYYGLFITLLCYGLHVINSCKRSGVGSIISDVGRCLKLSLCPCLSIFQASLSQTAKNTCVCQPYQSIY